RPHLNLSRISRARREISGSSLLSACLRADSAAEPARHRASVAFSRATKLLSPSCLTHSAISFSVGGLADGAGGSAAQMGEMNRSPRVTARASDFHTDDDTAASL